MQKEVINRGWGKFWWVLTDGTFFFFEKEEVYFVVLLVSILHNSRSAFFSLFLHHRDTWLGLSISSCVPCK